LRLAGILVGAHHGLVGAVIGVVAAQLVSTASIAVGGWLAFRRFPSAPSSPLGDDRREIVSFVVQSSAATGVLSVRGQLAPLLLGAVTTTTQLGFFRVAQAPQTAFQALSAPARMVLLAEQTRDWEAGRRENVLRGVRRYSAVAAGLMAVVVPLLMIFMPQLVHAVYPRTFWGVTDAARLFVAAAAVQFVVAWSKSLPVTIGRPNLRIWTHGVETLVVLPLVVVLGLRWGATGAAGAMLAGSCVFAIHWTAIFLRIRADDVHAPEPLGEAAANEEIEAAALAR
jgi:O-antigen/teichoic acid export membrane protein